MPYLIRIFDLRSKHKSVIWILKRSFCQSYSYLNHPRIRALSEVPSFAQRIQPDLKKKWQFRVILIDIGSNVHSRSVSKPRRWRRCGWCFSRKRTRGKSSISHGLDERELIRITRQKARSVQELHGMSERTLGETIAMNEMWEWLGEERRTRPPIAVSRPVEVFTGGVSHPAIQFPQRQTSCCDSSRVCLARNKQFFRRTSTERVVWNGSVLLEKFLHLCFFSKNSVKLQFFHARGFLSGSS